MTHRSQLAFEVIAAMDANHDGSIDKQEFISHFQASNPHIAP